MQVKELKSEGLSHELEVIVSAKDIDVKIDERLREVGKTLRLPGFRPGKAPMPLLKQRYGRAVLGEVLELAVNDATLFVSGNGYIKALARRNGDQLWRTDVGGNVLGGPYADNTKVIIYLENGTVQFLDSATGAVTSIATLSAPATGSAAAAISGQLIFAPGADGRLQALSGLP